jgi:hypothetical protein
VGIGFGEGDERTQVMGSAEGVLCRGAQVRLPVIVEQDAAKAAEQADPRQRRGAALGVHGVDGQERGARHRQPLQGAGDAHPRFIGMGHGAAHHGLTDRRHGCRQAYRRLATHSHESGRGERDARQDTEQLGTTPR